jgi:hypothetical protein
MRRNPQTYTTSCQLQFSDHIHATRGLRASKGMPFKVPLRSTGSHPQRREARGRRRLQPDSGCTLDKLDVDKWWGIDYS